MRTVILGPTGPGIRTANIAATGPTGLWEVCGQTANGPTGLFKTIQPSASTDSRFESLIIPGYTGGGGGGYVAKAVQTDGSTTYLKSAGLTGAIDSPIASFAGWIKPVSISDPINGLGNFLTPNTFNYQVDMGQGYSNGGFFWYCGTNPTAMALECDIADGSLSAGTWQWIAGMVDTNHADGSKIIQVYRGDTLIGNGGSDGNPAFDLGFAGVSWSFPDVGVGDPSPDNPFFNGGVAELFWYPGVFIDFSVEANRRKFFSAGGKPVDPATAIAAFGTPAVLLSGDKDGFVINQGSGGALTSHGTWANATTSPSD